MSGGERIVALVGATATGKTDLAIEAALRSRVPVEIVVLDSRQLYRRLDVGTGKPDSSQRAAVPHHLLDVLDPRETTDAMAYRLMVEGILEELFARGVQPLLVGGAGFYLRALTEGFHDLEHDGEQLRRVRESLGGLSDEELRVRLADVDPDTAARLHPNDRYRIGRALELHALHGRPASALHAEFTPQPVRGAQFEIVQLTAERSVLHERIARRTRAWLDGGWAEEVRQLLSEGYQRDCPGLGILGYEEVCAWVAGECGREEVEERIDVRTRRYARAQETWFRKSPALWAGSAEDPEASKVLVDALSRSPS